MVRTCGTRWPKIARPEADRMLTAAHTPNRRHRAGPPAGTPSARPWLRRWRRRWAMGCSRTDRRNRSVAERGLVVVAVEAHFPALPQQQPAKIAERLGIALAEGRVGSVVLIVLDHDARVPDAEPLGQLDEVRPPDLGVEIRDAQAVILPDVLAVALRHRRGKSSRKRRRC